MNNILTKTPNWMVKENHQIWTNMSHIIIEAISLGQISLQALQPDDRTKLIDEYWILIELKVENISYLRTCWKEHYFVYDGKGINFAYIYL